MLKGHTSYVRAVAFSSDGTPIYSESPLRQALSQQELQLYGQHGDIPPSLPPKHRETPTRRSRNEHPPSAFVPQPLRVGQKRSSVSDRSPLQALEDGYEMERGIQPPQDYHTPTRRCVYMDSPQAIHTPERQVDLQSQRDVYSKQGYASDPQLPRQRPGVHSKRNSYEIRHA